jgi:menaquinone-9 beta-reductase
VRNYDAIVVGGGPAGSTCARHLSVAGLSVLVVDAARFPRDKLCAGWITPRVVEAASMDPHEYECGGRTLQPFTGFRTGMIDGPSIHTDFERIVSFGILRCEFDQYLLDRAGAELATGDPVTTLLREGGRWIVNDKFEAPVIVGAGGHFCPVARRLNEQQAAETRGGHVPGLVVAQETELRMTPEQARRCRVEGRVPELYFCRDRAGYGWCVRKGDHLNVGLGQLGGRPLRPLVAAFASSLQRDGRIPADMPFEWKGHAYRVHVQPRRVLAGDGVVVVGDAAGLAHRVSGEGIVTAVESGRLAARSILSASGRYSAEELSSYVAMIDRRYGRPPVERPRTPLAASVVSRLVPHLMRSRRFVRRVLLDRWFLQLGRTPIS